jgi:hypothetical protein
MHLSLYYRVAYREAFCIIFRHGIAFSAMVLDTAPTYYVETLRGEIMGMRVSEVYPMFTRVQMQTSTETGNRVCKL